MGYTIFGSLIWEKLPFVTENATTPLELANCRRHFNIPTCRRSLSEPWSESLKCHVSLQEPGHRPPQADGESGIEAETAVLRPSTTLYFKTFAAPATPIPTSICHTDLYDMQTHKPALVYIIQFQSRTYVCLQGDRGDHLRHLPFEQLSQSKWYFLVILTLKRLQVHACDTG